MEKSTGKYLCRSLFLNKTSSIRPATLFKKRLGQRHFPVIFAKFQEPLIYSTSSGGCFKISATTRTAKIWEASLNFAFRTNTFWFVIKTPVLLCINSLTSQFAVDNILPAFANRAWIFCNISVWICSNHRLVWEW